MSTVRESVLLAQQQQLFTDDTMALKAVDTATAKALDIIDIQNARAEINLKDEILSQMNPEEGPRTLPTLLLYDEKGLQLFEDVCCCFPRLPPHSVIKVV
jgi:hypothetical protein